MAEINFLEVDSISQFRPKAHNLMEVNRVRKKAVIEISLVEESAEKANEEIEKEIFEELSERPAKIPWMEKVEKVTVTEA